MVKLQEITALVILIGLCISLHSCSQTIIDQSDIEEIKRSCTYSMDLQKDLMQDVQGLYGRYSKNEIDRLVDLYCEVLNCQNEKYYVELQQRNRLVQLLFFLEKKIGHHNANTYAEERGLEKKYSIAFFKQNN